MPTTSGQIRPPVSGMYPARRRGQRMAAPAIDHPQQKFINHQRRKHKQRLLKQRLGSHQQVQADGKIGHERQRQRVFAQQRALKHIERQAAGIAEQQPAGARQS